jgi:hypothetical protein
MLGQLLLRYARMGARKLLVIFELVLVSQLQLEICWFQGLDHVRFNFLGAFVLQL